MQYGPFKVSRFNWRGDCISERIGDTTEFPLKGTIGWSTYGVRVYGSFEAGIGDETLTIETSTITSSNVEFPPYYPCYNASRDVFYGYCPEGADVQTCDESLNSVCSGGASDKTEILLNSCGAHPAPYHFHNDLACYYDHSSEEHSPLVAYSLDGHGIYGLYEKDGAAPTDLDACNGHYGLVPEDGEHLVSSSTTEVYHYHTTIDFPFTLGCYGPMTFDECFESDPHCGNDYVDVMKADGNWTTVDTYCGCRQQPPTPFATVTQPAFTPTVAMSPSIVSPTATPMAAPTSAAPTAIPVTTAAPTLKMTTTVVPITASTAAPTRTSTSMPSPQPSTVFPTAAPTPSPTRTPIVAVSLGVEGITCYDFNATVFDLAIDSIVKNATFSDSACKGMPNNSVLVSNEVTLPLAIAATYGMSVHEVSASEHLRVTAVWRRRNSLSLPSYLRGSPCRRITARDQRTQRVCGRWLVHGGDCSLCDAARPASAGIGHCGR